MFTVGSAILNVCSRSLADLQLYDSELQTEAMQTVVHPKTADKVPGPIRPLSDTVLSDTVPL